MDDTALTDLLTRATEDPRPEFTQSMIDLLHRELTPAGTARTRTSSTPSLPQRLINGSSNADHRRLKPGATRRRVAWLACATILVIVVAFTAVFASARSDDRSASPRLLTAPRGSVVSWTAVSTVTAGLGTGATFNAIASVGDAVVLVGATPNGSTSRPAIWRSTNGTSWTSATLPTSTGTVATVASHGDELVAIGKGDTDWFVWRSVDRGTTWNATAQGPDVFGTPAPQMGRPSVDGVLWHNGRWVAYGAGSDGYEGVWVSESAAQWSQVQLDGSAGSAKIVPDNEGNLYAFWSTTVWRSTDALHWTLGVQAETPTGLFLRDVAPGATVAVGQQVDRHGQPTPLLRSNDNGAQWQIDQSFPDTQVQTITRTSDAWVATGTSNDQRPDALVSTDGQNWTRLPDTQRGTQGGVLNLVAQLARRTIILGAAPGLDRYYIATLAPRAKASVTTPAPTQPTTNENARPR